MGFDRLYKIKLSYGNATWECVIENNFKVVDKLFQLKNNSIDNCNKDILNQAVDIATVRCFLEDINRYYKYQIDKMSVEEMGEKLLAIISSRNYTYAFHHVELSDLSQNEQ